MGQLTSHRVEMLDKINAYTDIMPVTHELIAFGYGVLKTYKNTHVG